MPIKESQLGGNPLHRMRNRKASQILEQTWIDNYERNKPLLKHPKRVSFESLVSGRDTCVIFGAGPSVEKNIKTLSSILSKKAVDADYFTCEKSYPLLMRTDAAPIVPRVVTAINAQSPKDISGKAEVSRFWDAITDKSRTVLLSPLTADPITFSTWSGAICPILCALPVDLTDRMVKETGLRPLSGGSNVGVFTYLMASLMGYKNLVVCGMDYSFKTKREAMAHYAPDDPYMVWEGTDIKGEIRWTTWDWFDSALSFFEYSRFLWRAKGIRTINCSDGGILYDNEYIVDQRLEDVL